MSFDEWQFSLFLLFLLFLLFFQQIISHRDRVPRGNPGLALVWRTKEERGGPLFYRCFSLFFKDAVWSRRAVAAENSLSVAVTRSICMQ